MVYWLSWHCESGIWYPSFHIPFPQTAWITWWLLAVSTGSGAVAKHGAETQSDSAWLLLSVLWPQRASFPLPFHLCTSAAVVTGLSVLSLGHVVQHRLWQLRAVETLPILHTLPFRFTEMVCLHDELFARLFVLHRNESVWSFPDLTDWGLQNFYLSPLLID